MKIKIILCAMVLSLSSAVLAGDSKRDLAMKILEASGSAALSQQTFNHMIDIQKNANPEVPEKFWKEIKKEFNPNELNDLVADVWTKHFSEKDLKGLLKFYKSSLGKKLNKKMPLIVQESMEIGTEWGMELGQRIGEKLEKEMMEENEVDEK